MARRDRRQLPLFAAVGLALALPLSALPASAQVADASFFVKSENIQDPEITSTAGLEVEQVAPTPAPGGSASPAPGQTPEPEKTAPAEKPTESEKPPVVEIPPLLEKPEPVFVPGPGAYELKSVAWNQMSAKQVCADVTVRGTGGTVRDWYLTMNAATVPFNHDFSIGNYQFPVWGYGFEGGFDGSGKIRIVGKNFSQWNDFSTLTGGQERTLRICDWNTPKPPTTTEAEVTQLSASPGEWSWSARYRVTPKTQVEFFSSWKVRVDLSELNRGYRGSSPIHSDPGPADLKITHISGDIYEIEGIGWPNMGIRQDKSIEFRLGR